LKEAAVSVRIPDLVDRSGNYAKGITTQIVLTPMPFQKKILAYDGRTGKKFKGGNVKRV